MNAPDAKPLFRRVWPDLLAFATGLAMAYYFRWQTTDLVWSLWLCSLVLGYLTLLSAIGAIAWGFFWAAGRPETNGKERGQILMIGGIIGFVVFGFFSLHFCGFHAGHSVFLQLFFPRPGMPQDGFGAAFINPPLLWFLVFKHLMLPYGVFLIPAIIAERKHVFRPLIETLQASRSTRIDTEDDRAKLPKSLGDFMGRPYLNVIRMHILIFFFAFAHFAKIDSFAVYVVVYSVYFFPWSEIKTFKKANQPTANRPEYSVKQER